MCLHAGEERQARTSAARHGASFFIWMLNLSLFVRASTPEMCLRQEAPPILPAAGEANFQQTAKQRFWCWMWGWSGRACSSYWPHGARSLLGRHGTMSKVVLWSPPAPVPHEQRRNHTVCVRSHVPGTHVDRGSGPAGSSANYLLATARSEKRRTINILVQADSLFTLVGETRFIMLRFG